MECLRCVFTTTNEDDETTKYLDIVCKKDFKVLGFTKKDLLAIRKYMAIKNITLKELIK